VFCQDACKSKDYRDRKAKAQEMAAEGMSAKATAEEIQTDVATVKKWISKLG
jgi:transposase